jgi:antitoxin MazE
MLSKIQKWGNSQGIRIPLKILKNSDIAVGEEVEISIVDGSIVLKPTHKIHGKYDIKTLVAEMPADYQVEEVQWSKKQGKEEW